MKEEKKKSWEKFGEKMEENYKENQKLFYRTLKNFKKFKECPLKYVKNKQGNLLTDKKEVMERWKEHFEELLNEGQVEIIEEGEETEISNVSEEEITEMELRLAIKKMKKGKSAGHDKITPEMIKLLGPKAEKKLLSLMNTVWQRKQVPEDWEVAVLVPIYKKGDNRECKNHRGISLLSVVGKIYSRILEARLRKKVETQLEETQGGFRPNRSTTDLIFSVRMASQKMLEKNKTIHAAFIDLQQAFDRVPRYQLWTALKEAGVQPNLLEAIKSVYKKCRNYVRTANETSSEFISNQGVRQGCSLSPLLFIVFLDRITKACNKRIRRLKLGNHQLKPVYLNDLAYADDLMVMASSEANLQHNIAVWAEELAKKGMKINVEKTKTMIISKKEETHTITVDGTVLEKVNLFKYLGSVISANGKMDDDIIERIGAASRLFNSIRQPFLNKKEVTKKTKLAVYKSTFVPTLTYGCESWTLTEKSKSKLQAMEMRFLRKADNKTRRDRIRNTSIRKSLNVNPLLHTIQNQQLRWFGHLQRMPIERIPKTTKEVRVDGQRGRGRPRRTWEEGIEDVVRERGLTMKEAVALTADRKRWRSFVQSSTPPGTRGTD